MYQKYIVKARAGNADAQFEVAKCYAMGVGVEKSNMAAVGWYRLAASQKHTLACYTLGRIYEEGTLGVPKNRDEAMRLYQIAADKDHATAQHILRRMQNSKPLMTSDEDTTTQKSAKSEVPLHNKESYSVSQSVSAPKGDATTQHILRGMQDSKPLMTSNEDIKVQKPTKIGASSSIPQSIPDPNGVRQEAVVNPHKYGPDKPFLSACEIEKQTVLIRCTGQIQWCDDLFYPSNIAGKHRVTGERWGSGVLISRNHFLTAGHCVNMKKAPSSGWLTPYDVTLGRQQSPSEFVKSMKVNFNYQKSSVMSTDASAEPNEESYIVKSLVEHGEGKLDYAILELSGNPGDVYGYVTLSFNKVIHPCELHISQHPNGGPKKYDKGNFGGYVIKGYTGNAKYVVKADELYYTTINTDYGSSGSPVAINGSEVVGVHVRRDDAGGVRVNYAVSIIAIRDASDFIKGLYPPPILAPAPLKPSPVPEKTSSDPVRDIGIVGAGGAIIGGIGGTAFVATTGTVTTITAVVTAPVLLPILAAAAGGAVIAAGAGVIGYNIFRLFKPLPKPKPEHRPELDVSASRK